VALNPFIPKIAVGGSQLEHGKLFPVFDTANRKGLVIHFLWALGVSQCIFSILFLLPDSSWGCSHPFQGSKPRTSEQSFLDIVTLYVTVVGPFRLLIMMLLKVVGDLVSLLVMPEFTPTQEAT
jgi:hypothetical protein